MIFFLLRFPWNRCEIEILRVNSILQLNGEKDALKHRNTIMPKEQLNNEEIVEKFPSRFLL